MASRIIFRGVEIAFPGSCVVCGQMAVCDYSISRTITYGNRSITITLPVPMCQAHHDLATKKNAKERAVERVGMILGGLLGLGAAALLLSWWSSTNQGNLALNIFLALVVAASAFLIFWALFSFWLSPMFADEDTKAARNAVRIRKFWPGTKELQLDFFNEKIADRVAQVNKERISKVE